MEIKFEVTYQFDKLKRTGVVHADSLEMARDLARMEAVKIGATAVYVSVEPEALEVLNS